MSKQKLIIGRYFLIAIFLIVILVAAIFLNNTINQSDIKQNVAIIDIDNGDLNIAWHRFKEYNIRLAENLEITNPGIYHLTGSLIDKNIIINAPEAEVKLILDNVVIKNKTGPAIICYDADNLVIDLVGENTLEGGLSHSANYSTDVDGVIYSKTDLIMQGGGILNIVAHYQDGIVSKDDIKFNSGTYNIHAADDGIRGKDSVYIVDGTFNIDAKSDAIKSTNEAKPGKGFILIEGGELCVTSGVNGIRASGRRIIEKNVKFCRS